MQTTLSNNRNHGLDILRSTAIILVFLSHYNLLTDQKFFGYLGQMGGVGVDLFFALSGYLIGNQIFISLKNGSFSIKNFYIRRFFRIMPNYFVVLGLYFTLTIIRERPLTISLWKFITFTQNFYLIPGAFSHAWSLCIEEHFYLILPLLALLFYRKNNLRLVWAIIILVLLGEIIVRGSIWLIYLRYAHENIGLLSMRMIYAPTYTRVDSLVLGVALALIKNYQTKLWTLIASRGNICLLAGILGYFVVVYVYQNLSPNEFLSATLSYSLLALSSALLTLSALSPGSVLYKIRIQGTMMLATLSYAIYLTHKSFIHLTQTFLSSFNLEHLNLILLPSTIIVSIFGGWLLYTCIEKPFLKLREKISKRNPRSDFPLLNSVQGRL